MEIRVIVNNPVFLPSGLNSGLNSGLKINGKYNKPHHLAKRDWYIALMMNNRL